MKSIKLLLLLSALTITGCSSQKVASKSSSNIENTISAISSTSDIATSSSLEASSSSLESSSSSEASSSSSSQEQQTKFTISFVNPSCGTMSKEVIDTRLPKYINDTAGKELVASIKNSNCQIANNIPVSGTNTLIIGAASVKGSLAFTFTETVKKVSITAETYYKPYKDYATGEDVPNVDSESVLEITTDGASPMFFMDLKPVEEQPVEKKLDLEINNTALNLASSYEERGRVFIKEMVFEL